MIRDLLAGRGPPHALAAQQIEMAMQSAIFDEGSLAIHRSTRLDDEQWTERTTAAEYLLDIQAAIADPAAGLVVYERRGGAIAAVLAWNGVPAHRRGVDASALIFVVYSADRDRIITGYQTDGLHELAIPANAVWLRSPPPPIGGSTIS